MEKNVDYKGMLVIHGELYEFNQERNSIKRFNGTAIYGLDGFEVINGSYHGLYDPKHHELHHDTPDFTAHDREWYPVFSIPKEVMEAGHLLSDEALKKYNEQSFKLNHGYCLVDEELSERLNGVLPRFMFDGNSYVVDLEKLEFRNEHDPNVKFEFDRRAFFSEEVQYYNTETKRPVQSDDNAKEYGPEIICVKFPRISLFDTVGYNKQMPTGIVSRSQWNEGSKYIEIIPVERMQLTQVSEKKRDMKLKTGHEKMQGLKKRKSKHL